MFLVPASGTAISTFSLWSFLTKSFFCNDFKQGWIFWRYSAIIHSGKIKNLGKQRKGFFRNSKKYENFWKGFWNCHKIPQPRVLSDLHENSIRLWLFSYHGYSATETDSKYEFFHLRGVIFDILVEKTKHFFSEKFDCWNFGFWCN